MLPCGICWVYDHAGVLCNMGYPSETHLKPKSREISFAHNLLCGYPIVITFCTEHGSDTAVLCAKFQNDWTTETDVMNEWDFARFGSKGSFGQIFYILTWTWARISDAWPINLLALVLRTVNLCVVRTSTITFLDQNWDLFTILAFWYVWMSLLGV